MNNKYIQKNFYHIKNIIKRRIIISNYLNKYADFLNDLKSFPQFKKYFITKEEADSKHKKMKENKDSFIDPKDLDWWKQTNEERQFYVYTYPGNGGLTPLYAKCFVAEFARRGYDDFTCLLAVYKVDEKKDSNQMIGYNEYVNMTLLDTIHEILNVGVVGWGKHYYCGGDIYYDLDDLKPIAEKACKDISNNVNINEIENK